MYMATANKEALAALFRYQMFRRATATHDFAYGHLIVLGVGGKQSRSV